MGEHFNRARQKLLDFIQKTENRSQIRIQYAKAAKKILFIRLCISSCVAARVSFLGVDSPEIKTSRNYKYQELKLNLNRIWSPSDKTTLRNYPKLADLEWDTGKNDEYSTLGEKIKQAIDDVFDDLIYKYIREDLYHSTDSDLETIDFEYGDLIENPKPPNDVFFAKMVYPMYALLNTELLVSYLMSFEIDAGKKTHSILQVWNEIAHGRVLHMNILGQKIITEKPLISTFDGPVGREMDRVVQSNSPTNFFTDAYLIVTGHTWLYSFIEEVHRVNIEQTMLLPTLGSQVVIPIIDIESHIVFKQTKYSRLLTHLSQPLMNLIQEEAETTGLIFDIKSLREVTSGFASDLKWHDSLSKSSFITNPVPHSKLNQMLSLLTTHIPYHIQSVNPMLPPGINALGILVAVKGIIKETLTAFTKEFYQIMEEIAHGMFMSPKIAREYRTKFVDEKKYLADQIKMSFVYLTHYRNRMPSRMSKLPIEYRGVSNVSSDVKTASSFFKDKELAQKMRAPETIIEAFKEVFFNASRMLMYPEISLIEPSYFIQHDPYLINQFHEQLAKEMGNPKLWYQEIVYTRAVDLSRNHEHQAKEIRWIAQSLAYQISKESITGSSYSVGLKQQKIASLWAVIAPLFVETWTTESTFRMSTEKKSLEYTSIPRSVLDVEEIQLLSSRKCVHVPKNIIAAFAYLLSRNKIKDIDGIIREHIFLDHIAPRNNKEEYKKKTLDQALAQTNMTKNFYTTLYNSEVMLLESLYYKEYYESSLSEFEVFDVPISDEPIDAQFLILSDYIFDYLKISTRPHAGEVKIYKDNFSPISLKTLVRTVLTDNPSNDGAIQYLDLLPNISSFNIDYLMYWWGSHIQELLNHEIVDKGTYDAVNGLFLYYNIPSTRRIITLVISEKFQKPKNEDRSFRDIVDPFYDISAEQRQNVITFFKNVLRKTTRIVHYMQVTPKGTPLNSADIICLLLGDGGIRTVDELQYIDTLIAFYGSDEMEMENTLPKYFPFQIIQERNQKIIANPYFFDGEDTIDTMVLQNIIVNFITDLKDIFFPCYKKFNKKLTPFIVNLLIGDYIDTLCHYKILSHFCKIVNAEDTFADLTGLVKDQIKKRSNIRSLLLMYKQLSTMLIQGVEYFKTVYKTKDAPGAAPFDLFVNSFENSLSSISPATIWVLDDKMPDNLLKHGPSIMLHFEVQITTDSVTINTVEGFSINIKNRNAVPSSMQYIYVVGHKLSDGTPRVFVFYEYTYLLDSDDLESKTIMQTVYGPFYMEKNPDNANPWINIDTNPTESDSSIMIGKFLHNEERINFADNSATESDINGFTVDTNALIDIATRDIMKDIMIPYLHMIKHKYAREKKLIGIDEESKYQSQSLYLGLVLINVNGNGDAFYEIGFFVTDYNAQSFNSIGLETGQRYFDYNIFGEINSYRYLLPISFRIDQKKNDTQDYPLVGLHMNINIYKWVNEYMVFPFHQITKITGPWTDIDDYSLDKKSHISGGTEGINPQMTYRSGDNITPFLSSDMMLASIKEAQSVSFSLVVRDNDNNYIMGPKFEIDKNRTDYKDLTDEIYDTPAVSEQTLNSKKRNAEYDLDLETIRTIKNKMDTWSDELMGNHEDVFGEEKAEEKEEYVDAGLGSGEPMTNDPVNFFD
jgi:hypothetical protein